MPFSAAACDNVVPLPAWYAGGSSDPDLQIRFVAGYALDPDAIQSYIKIGQLKQTKQKWPAGVTMQLLTARPKSKGTVGLKSTDPFDLPKVGPTHLLVELLLAINQDRVGCLRVSHSLVHILSLSPVCEV